MTWWKKDEKDLPEKLRGMTPEQILAQTEENERLKADLAVRDATITQHTSEIEQTRARLAELEANAARATQPPPREDEIPSVLIDEDAAFARRQKPVMAVALYAAITSARMLARDHVRDMPRDVATGVREFAIWQKYESEITQLMSKQTPEYQAQPGNWLATFNYVKGTHMGDILKMQRESTDFFAEESAGRTPPPPPNPDKLTDEELDICRKMKIKPEDYLASKKGIVFATS